MKKYRIVKEGIEREWRPGTFTEWFVVQRRFLWLFWLDDLYVVGGAYTAAARFANLRLAVEYIAQRIKPKQGFKPRTTSEVIWTTGENYPA